MSVQVRDAFVGATGMISSGGLGVEVIVLDRKTHVDQTGLLVTPVAGTGMVWVDLADVFDLFYSAP